VTTRPALTTRSLWDDADAAEYRGALDERVYSSRLLGRDTSLVVHGGGNTSVKTKGRDALGRDLDLLYVKGSGWDLATIEPAGFAPVRLDALIELATLDRLSDIEMARQLRLATVDPSAPAPSVEAIVHALLPFRFVDHTHPDPLISVMNTPSGAARIGAIYGDDVVVVPYVMPGFPLAKAASRAFAQQAHDGTIGMVLLQHGLFTFADDARESYERTIELVGRAEGYLRAEGAWEVPDVDVGESRGPFRHEIAALRRDLSDAAGRPLVVLAAVGARGRDFARRANVARVSQSGPATPDHVIRTKRVPMLGRNVAEYAAAYEQYFDVNAGRASAPLTMLDPAPRVVLDAVLGLVTAGTTAAAAVATAEIYAHTIDTILRAEQLERWRALPAADVFDVEYWDLEQAKLRQAQPVKPFSGEIAVVTGAASGIGRACARAFLALGACVVGLDVSPADSEVAADGAFLGLRCDVTDEAAVADAFEQTARAFGGLDVLVLNAGLLPPTRPIAKLELAEWQRTMRVNLDANLILLREAHPLLKLAPNGGRVVVNASKNVPAPGPGAAAYSASKAALTQLARVAALEWGRDGIRVNVVHPNAVFDTGLWSSDVLAERAASYGLTVDEYRRNNVLRTEVTSADVASVIAQLCLPAFAKTTGAQIAVDGGNERVI
jgi:rhamnose utilization protein RhaD (predicted bifunctional aldolase and dehydrogenase)/NAD(P)-dependent dehydrogenase (short-subunit alcohol dehydrogenase family)